MRTCAHVAPDDSAETLSEERETYFQPCVIGMPQARAALACTLSTFGAETFGRMPLEG
jgi:hypothetical protein